MSFYPGHRTEAMQIGFSMNLKILNKTNLHYWDKKKTDWAVQDKKGFWWIIPGSEMAKNKLSKDKRVNIPSRKTNQSSMPANLERMALIIVSALLGVSFAINVVYYLLR